MANSLDKNGLDLIFRNARTCRNWRNSAIPEMLLQKLYKLTSLGPPSVNCQPARFVFVISSDAKDRLKPCLAAGNINKTMTASATVIIARDVKFFELMGNAESASNFPADKQNPEIHGFRNSTLQAAYLIIAARAIGLDCGPMSGFDQTTLDKEFFPDGRLKSNLLINLGYGDKTGMPERLPRHAFGEACKIL